MRLTNSLILFLLGLCEAKIITTEVTKGKSLGKRPYAKKKPDVASLIQKRHGVMASSNSTTKKLTNVDDLTLYTYISYGDDSQSLSTLLDTGSPWVFALSKDCSTCQDMGITLYDATRSKSYINDQTPYELDYGSGTVNGYVSEDMICLSQNQCSDDFKFILGT